MKTNALKIAAMMLMLAGSCSSCAEEEESPQKLGCDCKDELYYYTQGKKVFFDDRFLNDWLLVGFYPQVQDAEIVDFINKMNIFKQVDDIRFIMRLSDDVEYTSFNYNYARIYVNTKEQKTCTQLKEIIRILEETSIVAFANITFWWDEFYKMVSFSPYFYVNVKDANDLSDLYTVSKETNTDILEQPNRIHSNRFVLRVNNDSKGNALQMANYFYETGKFDTANADWYGFYAVLHNQ